MIRLIGPGGAARARSVRCWRSNSTSLSLTWIGILLTGSATSGTTSTRTDTERMRERTLRPIGPWWRGETADVVALSSGFMTYSLDIHPEYPTLRRGIGRSPTTFVLLPSVDRDVCVAETVRRQVGGPFGRSPSREEAVIRARFEIYSLCPCRRLRRCVTSSRLSTKSLLRYTGKAVENALGREASAPLLARRLPTRSGVYRFGIDPCSVIRSPCRSRA